MKLLYYEDIVVWARWPWKIFRNRNWTKNPICLITQLHNSLPTLHKSILSTHKTHREKNRLKVLISTTTKGMREKCEHKNRKNYVPTYALQLNGIGEPTEKKGGDKKLRSVTHSDLKWKTNSLPSRLKLRGGLWGACEACTLVISMMAPKGVRHTIEFKFVFPFSNRRRLRIT